MPRNLVLCLDGTGNEYGERNSNVVALHSLLLRDAERQVSFYDPGLGTAAAPAALTPPARLATRLLGLGFGLGISRNIAAAYRFLVDHYERGDRVFLFGFSRGAYTARAVAALLYQCGLLERHHANLVPAAIRMLRRERRPRVYGGFRRSFSRRCSVQFLGLWDTVKSVGWIWEPLRLPFTMRNRVVKTVRHALAIDERRCFYRQNQWGAAYPHQDVRQVWFAGAHSDVGGSYPEEESGPARIALAWMAAEAERCGLLLDPRARRQDHRRQPDLQAPLHRSLAGWWWLPELLPKRYEDPARSFARRWMIPAGRRRFIAPGAVVHASVVDRLTSTTYRPPNLPERYGVEPWSAAPEVE